MKVKRGAINLQKGELYTRHQEDSLLTKKGRIGFNLCPLNFKKKKEKQEEKRDFEKGRGLILVFGTSRLVINGEKPKNSYVLMGRMTLLTLEMFSEQCMSHALANPLASLSPQDNQENRRQIPLSCPYHCRASLGGHDLSLWLCEMVEDLQP